MIRPIATFLIVIFNVAYVQAEESYPERPSYQVISKEKDSSIKHGKSIIEFYLNGLPESASDKLLAYSVNEKIKAKRISSKETISEKLDAGTYNFQFFYTDDYLEIFINSFKLEAGYRVKIQLNFKSAQGQNQQVRKPVIYLYPEQTQQVNLTVKPRGKMTFTYPTSDGTWSLQADPNGTLTVNDKKYNYLFWEAEQKAFKDEQAWQSGFFVPADSTISFLEDKLQQFGLNSVEAADFITFWGPLMQKNKTNVVHFYFNEECNRFGTLHVDPKPKHVNRIYIAFIEKEITNFKSLEEQIIPKSKRDGFTVIEWGGVSY